MRRAYDFLISILFALLAVLFGAGIPDWPIIVDAPPAVVAKVEYSAPAPVVVEPGVVRRTTSGPSPGQWRSA